MSVLTAFLVLGHSAMGMAAHAPADCAVLQAELLALSSAGGGSYQLEPHRALTCTEGTLAYKYTRSTQGLLVPERVDLDLAGGSIALDLTSDNAYGIRLASFARVRNGSVTVLDNGRNGGFQEILHSAISVGAAFDDGGLVASPSYFSEVHHWSIENVDIDQRKPKSAIAIMSGAHDGLIDNARIHDSPVAAIGISLHWGAVGSFSSNDRLLGAMRALRETETGYLVYTTHPHDITISNIQIGRLGANVSDDSAGIRIAAAHRIRISKVDIGEAGCGVVVRAGDVGYEYARDQERGSALQGIDIENVIVHNAHRKGIFLDGFADNIYRAVANQGYKPRLPPSEVAIDAPRIRFVNLMTRDPSAGSAIELQFVKSALLEGVSTNATDFHPGDPRFRVGIRIAQNVSDTTVVRSDLVNNAEYGVYIYGDSKRGFSPPSGLRLLDNHAQSNGICWRRNYNGTGISESGNLPGDTSRCSDR